MLNEFEKTNFIFQNESSFNCDSLCRKKLHGKAKDFPNCLENEAGNTKEFCNYMQQTKLQNSTPFNEEIKNKAKKNFFCCIDIWSLIQNKWLNIQKSDSVEDLDQSILLEK